MTIDDLKNAYFVQPSDASPPTEPAPNVYENNLVKPLIDCAEYNEEIAKALVRVGGPNDFILIANWFLGLSGGKYVAAQDAPSAFGPLVRNTSPFLLDGPGGSIELIEMLKDRAKKGVDVRVLGWVSYSVMDSNTAQKNGAAHIAEINSLTMKAIKNLRAEPKIGPKAMLNVIGHSAGSVHCKLVVIGTENWAVGFTGGLDF